MRSTQITRLCVTHVCMFCGAQLSVLCLGALYMRDLVVERRRKKVLLWFLYLRFKTWEPSGCVLDVWELLAKIILPWECGNMRFNMRMCKWLMHLRKLQEVSSHFSVFFFFCNAFKCCGARPHCQQTLWVTVNSVCCTQHVHSNHSWPDSGYL